ncbi:hypothetical protein [Microcoleus sp. POL10_C6]|uniref:hypothetical protein n=1 Tax=Microcoleus sp. POL10_C6 TaxID=2818852 RepID=UPI002FD6DA42
MEPHFVHPLSSVETIDTDEGQKQVMNNWAFASMIWTATIAGNINAIAMATELFTDQEQFYVLVTGSKAGNQAAIATAIALLAFAIDDKLEQAFLNQQNQHNQDN